VKAQYLTAEMKKYRPTGPTQQELMKIFHTTRHVFDPKFVRLMIFVAFVTDVMKTLKFLKLCLHDRTEPVVQLTASCKKPCNWLSSWL